ncbi:MAG TPA: NAD-dependent epimerase/dehydratase family protein [Gemmatimonadales bacterium]
MTADPPPRPWLVTGASGFLGRHLLQVLGAIRHPPPVLALVRDRQAWARLDWTSRLERVLVLEGSVTESERWASDPLLEGLGGIFHLAAVVSHRRRDAGHVSRTIVEGTLAMVRLAAAHRCRLVFVSTSGTVGCFSRPGEIADEDAPYCDDQVRNWPYYRSKIQAERESRRLAAEFGVELVIARPPVLLGPGDHRFRSTGYVLRFLRGRVPFVIRGGMHFADVRDIARALVRAMERPRVRPVYHFPGTICTIQEFFALVAEVSGKPPPRLVLPFRPAWWLALLTARLGIEALPDPSVIEMASRHWAVRSRYAEQDLGYRSRPARETMAETVAWLRANHPALAGSKDAPGLSRPRGAAGDR